MTRLKDLFEYLDYLDNCSDGQFLKFIDAMKKRGYEYVTTYVHDYDYPHVTHCKDCKWFGKSGCAVLIVDESDKPDEDDFCSWAERRDDNDQV